MGVNSSATPPQGTCKDPFAIIAMFEDHWYQHSVPAAAVEPAPKMPRQESVKSSQPLERTSSNPSQKTATVQRHKATLDPPVAEVSRRPKSYGDLRSLIPNRFILLGKDKDKPEGGTGELPRRSKSWNDLEAAKIERYGQGKGQKGRRKPISKNPREIKDELDFVEWYGEFEDRLQDANSEYQLFYSTLQSHLTTCNFLLTTTDSTLAILSDLQTSFETVHAQTSAFQARSSALVAHSDHLTTLLTSISTALHPFAELEPITRLLARPGSDFVKTPAFREMLLRLDSCIDWMNTPAHRSFPDVESYAPKFRQCMTRALTLVRNYFVAGVREVANEVSGRIKERQMNDTTQSALLYAKFRVNAPVLRDLVAEIERRCGHEEYLSLLTECYSAFEGVRQKLITPIIHKRMTEPMSQKGKDLVAYARSVISFVRSICMDEFGLFYAYFSGEQGDGEVYNFLETLCESLYDNLRPRIIHETQLVKLCELCTLIQTRYMRDPEDADTDPFDRTQLDFGQLIAPTLHDTQNRIVFRAQTIIRDEIEGYAIKPEDLDYPAKITHPPISEGTSTPIPNAPALIDDDATAGTFGTESTYAGWYPTLSKCIWLLSRIYRLVNSTVFDDLAHTIVHLTTHSLIRASVQLQGRRSPADAHLFLIRHFLLLKAQIVAFDIEFVKPDTSIDFSGLAGGFWELREKGIFSRTRIINLLKGAAMPKVVENMLDAKVELDARLRAVIGEFGKYWKGRMVDGIEGAGRVTNPLETVREDVQREVGVLRGMLEVYLDDGRTREMLVGAVQELVVQAYESYYGNTFLSGNRRPSDSGEIWDVETFVAWSNDVFGVGLGLLEHDGQGGSEDGSPELSRAGSL